LCIGYAGKAEGCLRNVFNEVLLASPVTHYYECI